MGLNYTVFAEPKDFGAPSGDAYFVREMEDSLLVGVMDGLGHGEAAHHAATLAKDYFMTTEIGSFDYLFKGSHQALVGSRGVVASLMYIDTRAKTFMWAGVGNVEGYFGSSEKGCLESLLKTNGALGFNLPPKIMTYTFSYIPGDLFILHTDGFLSQGAVELWEDMPPELTVDTLHNAGFTRQNDDGLFMVGALP